MLRNRLAFTLVEVLIVLGLVALLLGLLAQLAVPAWRLGLRTQSRLDMDLAVVRLVDQLERDLGQTTSSGCAPGTDGVVLQPCQGVTDAGEPVWAPQWIVYHRDSDGSLWRGVGSPTHPLASSPSLPTLSELGQLLGAGYLPRKVLAAWVEEFSLTPSSLDPALLRLHLLLRRTVPGRAQPEQVTWDRDLGLWR